MRQLGVSEQTCYLWKQAFGGHESEQVREFRQVAEENARLKQLEEKLSLDKAVLQKALSKTFRGHRS